MKPLQLLFHPLTWIVAAVLLPIAYLARIPLLALPAALIIIAYLSIRFYSWNAKSTQKSAKSRIKDRTPAWKRSRPAVTINMAEGKK
ncbi:MAG: hypothetical protein PHH26_00430 [Candidatus Thermoplasmatota archaeon]|nr:hypothetical protein [Candidatus Thermoplasmatota archaeon]